MVCCFECGSKNSLHKHHVVPKSKGGTRTVRLCVPCHNKVHGMSLKALQPPTGCSDKEKRRIGKLLNQGHTCAEISALFNREGLPSPAGGDWTQSGLKELARRNGIGQKDPAQFRENQSRLGMGMSLVEWKNYKRAVVRCRAQGLGYKLTARKVSQIVGREIRHMTIAAQAKRWGV